MQLLQWCGVSLALIGFVVLVLPGLESPPTASAELMIAAGIAWGMYSLRGKRVGDPVATTAGNFLRTVPLTVILSLIAILLKTLAQVDMRGVVLGVVSGALAFGLGYVIWYAALPHLLALRAAVVQLSVQALAAFAGIVCLGEQLAWRLSGAAVLILGGIAMTAVVKQLPKPVKSIPKTQKM